MHDFKRAHAPGFNCSSGTAGDDTQPHIHTHTRTRVAELQTQNARCLCCSACAHPPNPPCGHMCAHTRVRHADWEGVQEMRPSEVDVPFALRLDYFGCPFAPYPCFAGAWGAVREGGEQRAPACGAHGRVPPSACRQPSIPLFIPT